MIKSGMCSVTLSGLSAEEVIKIAVESQMDGIEWWGSGHIPAGNFEVAKRIGILTSEAGLEVAAYGSYYRVGISDNNTTNFETVLETAHVLGAPTIRVWAGDKDYAQSEESHIQTVINDTFRIADMAAKRGISITFEYHGGTLTDRNETAVRFANSVQHPNVYFSWQPPHGYSLEHCLNGLEGLLDRLNTIHVYHWTIGSYEKNSVNETIRPLKYPDDFYRHPLSDGKDRWNKFIQMIKTTNRAHYMFLEFVKNDEPLQVVEDYRILKELI